MAELTIRFATVSDAPAMLEIYRPHVERSVVSFEWEVPKLEEFSERVRSVSNEYPWLLAESAGEVIGYAYAGRYRVRKAYQWSAETSVYVKDSAHRKGVARKLYARLLETLRVRGFLMAYAVITLPNSRSVGFHEACGFKYLCTFPQAGFKLGGWHDVGWWRLEIAPPPAEPKDPASFGGPGL